MCEGETTLSIRTTLICRLAASDLICETGRETGRACWLQQHESLTLVSTSAKFHNDQKLHRYSRNLPWSARREAGNKTYNMKSLPATHQIADTYQLSGCWGEGRGETGVLAAPCTTLERSEQGVGDYTYSIRHLTWPVSQWWTRIRHLPPPPPPTPGEVTDTFIQSDLKTWDLNETWQTWSNHLRSESDVLSEPEIFENSFP